MKSNKKTRVGILFGGKSAEHEVSLQSAKNVIDAIDLDKYEVTLIGIDESGKWILPNKTDFLLNPNDPSLIRLNKQDKEDVALVPQSFGEITNLSNNEVGNILDVIFPILHGPFGEDGTIQGLLKLARIPFVGASVLGSAIGMDKDVMNRLLRDANIPIADFLVFTKNSDISFDDIVKELGIPFFVKPANLGSSIGVSKVDSKSDFEKAIDEAFQYDTKVIVEEFIDGRELECSVLGNQNPIASVIGEIIPNDDFYSYEAKYINKDGARLEVPSSIHSKISKEAQELAIRTFKTLSCEGMGRVDLFLKENGELMVNEINTIPGFTAISMYPRLWEASGISYRDLISRLLDLAIERFQIEEDLKTSR